MGGNEVWSKNNAFNREVLLLLWQNVDVFQSGSHSLHWSPSAKAAAMALAFQRFPHAELSANAVSSPHKTCSWIMSSCWDCRQSASLAASAVSADACRGAPLPRWRGRRQRGVWLEAESAPGATGLSLDLKGKSRGQSWHIPYTTRQIHLTTSLQHALCIVLSGKSKPGVFCIFTKQYPSPSPPLELHGPDSAKRL